MRDISNDTNLVVIDDEGNVYRVRSLRVCNYWAKTPGDQVIGAELDATIDLIPEPEQTALREKTRAEIAKLRGENELLRSMLKLAALGQESRPESEKEES